MLCPNQIRHRLVTGNKRGVHCVGRKIVAIAGAEPVRLVSDAQLKLAAENPVRLIFGMSVRAVLCSRRVSPFEDAVALV